MKQFSTTRFGEITFESSQVYLFAQGIVGFPHLKNFVLVEDNESSMHWLQSLDDDEIAFVLIEPTQFLEPYPVRLSIDELRILKAADLEDLHTYVILTLPGIAEEITANLKAPIFLNKDHNIGGQVILTQCDHSSRYRIHDGKALDQDLELSGDPMTATTSVSLT